MQYFYLYTTHNLHPSSFILILEYNNVSLILLFVMLVYKIVLKSPHWGHNG